MLRFDADGSLLPYVVRIQRIVLLLVLLAWLAGCWRAERPESEPIADLEPGVDRYELTPESAKEALIDMLESLPPDKRFLKSLLPGLRRAKIEMRNDNKVDIGPWVCNLANGTFGVTVGRPSAMVVSYSGVFYRTPSGELKAEIRTRFHAH